MNDEKINELVTKLETFFIGYKAYENSLKNDNGMELFFRKDWQNKTTVSGLHAKHRHSIGCSFKKSPEKIFKDIRQRLMPDYYNDFFEAKRERIKRQELEENEILKLKALASVIGGKVDKHYGDRHARGNDYVSTENVSIYPTYNDHYEFKIDLNYVDSMKMAQLLKNFSL